MIYYVHNLPTNYQKYKYIVIKDLTDEGEGYWYWCGYETLQSSQDAIDEFFGTDIKVRVVEPDDIYPCDYE